MSRLSEFAVAKRSVTLLLAGALFIAGILAWGNLQQELLPDIELPVITVIAPLPGAGAADVAEQVTKPIERAISGVPRLEALQSTSANSISLVIAQFSFGTDVKETQALIEQSIQAANLPASVDPTVAALNINASPVIIASVAATTPDGLSEAARITQTEIQPALLGIEGVASVDVSGGAEQQVAITLDPAKLAEANVSQAQVVGVLTANNITIPSGQVQGDGTKTPVSTIGVIGSRRRDPRTWSSASQAPAQPVAPARQRIRAARRLRQPDASAQPPAARPRRRPQADHHRRPRHGRGRRRPDDRLRAHGNPRDGGQPSLIAVGDQDLDRQHGRGRRRRHGQARGARRPARRRRHRHGRVRPVHVHQGVARRPAPRGRHSARCSRS